MNEVICSVCREVKLTTARTIELPYVCNGCQPEESTMENTQESQRPATDYVVEALTTPELKDESATIESTIQLVADLESQLQAAKELTAGQTELIAQMEQQAEILKEDLRNQTMTTIEVTNENNSWRAKTKIQSVLINAMNEAGIELASDFNQSQEAVAELAKIGEALSFHLGYANAKNQRLEQQVEILKSALAVVGALGGVEVRIIS